MERNTTTKIMNLSEGDRFYYAGKSKTLFTVKELVRDDQTKELKVVRVLKDGAQFTNNINDLEKQVVFLRNINY